MNNDIVLDENAKDDWLKIVKKHKKRQKGLPALSTLNTDAGNVEHNINMFNMMNTPNGTPSVNPMNGSVSSDGGCGECTAMGEALKPYPAKTIKLFYEDLLVEVVTNVYGGYFYDDPPDYNTARVKIDWEEEVTIDSVIEVLQDIEELQAELDPYNDLGWKEFQAEIEDDLDYYVEKYSETLLAFFKEGAIEHASDYYREHDYFDESMNSKSTKLDDVFDMSTRTLL